MRMLIAMSFVTVAAAAAASQTATPPQGGADERCASRANKIEALTVKQGTAAPGPGAEAGGAGTGTPTAIINTSRSNIRGNRVTGPQTPDCPRDRSHDVHELEK